MPHNLIRHQHTGDVHFVTFSCDHRLPYLATPQARDFFEHGLDSVLLLVFPESGRTGNILHVEARSSAAFLIEPVTHFFARFYP
jgi:hypothetical protein